MANKKPTPEEIEAARALVAEADKEEADARAAEAQARAEARQAKIDQLAELVRSPAYQEVKAKLAELVPVFLAEPESAHVSYLSSVMHQVEAFAPPAA